MIGNWRRRRTATSVDDFSHEYREVSLLWIYQILVNVNHDSNILQSVKQILVSPPSLPLGSSHKGIHSGTQSDYLDAALQFFNKGLARIHSGTQSGYLDAALQSFNKGLARIHSGTQSDYLDAALQFFHEHEEKSNIHRSIALSTLALEDFMKIVCKTAMKDGNADGPLKPPWEQLRNRALAAFPDPQRKGELISELGKSTDEEGNLIDQLVQSVHDGEGEKTPQLCLILLKRLLTSHEAQFFMWPVCEIAKLMEEVHKVFKDASATASPKNTFMRFPCPTPAERYLGCEDDQVEESEFQERDYKSGYKYLSGRLWFDPTYKAGICAFSSALALVCDRKSAISFMQDVLSLLLVMLAQHGNSKLTEADQWQISNLLDLVQDGVTVTANSDEEEDTNKADTEVDADEVWRKTVFGLELQMRCLVSGIIAGADQACDPDDGEDNTDDGDEDEDHDDTDDIDSEVDKSWAQDNQAGSNSNNDNSCTGPLVRYNRALSVLCGMIGRRILALYVCLEGRGSLLARKRMGRTRKWWNLRMRLGEYAPNDATGLEQVDEEVLEEFPLYPNRVINTHTFEFVSDPILFKDQYAILSHTWSQTGCEVSYREAPRVFAIAKLLQIDAQRKKVQLAMLRSEAVSELGKLLQIDAQRKKVPLSIPKDQLTMLRSKAVSELEKHLTTSTADDTAKNTTPEERKLLSAIQNARSLGFQYLWADNCCINKADNAELAEALSNMGAWYANAALCIVYLDDCYLTENDLKDPQKPATSVKRPRWGNRGWTLQEIIMSKEARLYNGNWEHIFYTGSGWKSWNPLIADKISRLCNVPKPFICYNQKPDCATAVILHLASRRKSTRPEDAVYSLQGVLGVRITADYGEGFRKALARLFDELIRSGTADASIFNWKGLHRGNPQEGRSMYPEDMKGYASYATGSCVNISVKYRIPHGVTSSAAGITSRFDVYPIHDLLFESDNAGAYKHVRQIAKMSTEHQNNPTDVRTECSISLTPDHDLQFYCLISCPVDILCATLASIMNPAVTNSEQPKIKVKWLMARFAQADANWLLFVMLEQALDGPQGANKVNLLGGIIQDEDEAQSSPDSTGLGFNLVRYLEESGLHARRIPFSLGFHVMPGKDGQPWEKSSCTQQRLTHLLSEKALQYKRTIKMIVA